MANLYEVNGFNEDFIGWGGEDDYQTMKVKHFLKWTELKAISGNSTR